MGGTLTVFIFMDGTIMSSVKACLCCAQQKTNSRLLGQQSMMIHVVEDKLFTLRVIPVEYNAVSDDRAESFLRFFTLKFDVCFIRFFQSKMVMSHSLFCHPACSATSCIPIQFTWERQ